MKTPPQQLRRLLCRCVRLALVIGSPLVLAATSAVAAPPQKAVYDELCGWVDDSVASEQATDIQRDAETISDMIPPFFSVTVGDQLRINTCNYDDWLAATVKNTGATTDASPSQHRDDILERRIHCVSRSDPRFPSPAFVPIVDFDGRLEAGGSLDVAAEPGGVRDTPDSGITLIETTPRIRGEVKRRPKTLPESVVKQSLVSPGASQRLIGGSAVVMTIPEPYLPYDLADQDLGATASSQAIMADREISPAHASTSGSQGSFALTEILGDPWKPFCIRSLVMRQQRHWSPLAAVERSVKSRPKQRPLACGFAIGGMPPETSADCLLDEWCWQLQQILEEQRGMAIAFEPHEAGGAIAAIALRGDRWVGRVADRLAAVWPREAPAAGARLIARAQAAERDDVLPAETVLGRSAFTPEQLAEFQATLRQWFESAERAVSVVSRSLGSSVAIADQQDTRDDPMRR